MPSSRMFYANYLTENNPTVTFATAGGAVEKSGALISTAQPAKAGYATGTPLGTYTGYVDKFYRIEIHVAGTGAFGSAQWRWTDAADVTPIVWNASNLATTNGAVINLSNGVQWRFDQVGVSTPQFTLGDFWIFTVTMPYGYEKGLDGSRDHEYRSGIMPASSTIEHRYEFATAVQPTGFAWMDHNIPSNATIALKAKASGFTDPPDATIPITWNSGKISAVITSSAYRYWRFCVTLAGTSLPYLSWSELFLGASVVFTKTFRIDGFQDMSAWLGAINLEALSHGPGPRMLEGRTIRLTYGRMSAADQAKLATVRAWINSATFNVMRPFFFVVLDSDMTNFVLCHWTNGYGKDAEFFERYSVPVELAEVVRRIA